MQSPEKVRQAAHELLEQLPALQAQASGMQAMALAAAASFAPGLVGQALASLPADPEQLDAILDVAAGYIAALKSDPPDYIEGQVVS